MGKHRYKKCSRISVFNGHPGCLWGILLHVLEYEHWSYLKKSLPHWKHGGNKQATGDGNPGNNKGSDAGKLQETSNAEVNISNVEEKVRQDTPANKNSAKAKIKAVVSEELSKTKGQNYESTTYPVRPQLMRTNSIHRLDPSHEDFLAKILSDDGNPGTVSESNGNSKAMGSMDPLLPKSFEVPIANEETYEDCQLMLTQNGMEHDQIDETKPQLLENHIPLQENLDDSWEVLSEINTKEINTDDSLDRSEELLNALGIINLNKEFFIKLLHDPSSPLARHFNNQQTISAKMGLTKSETFPLPGLSSRRRGRGPRKLKQKLNVIRSHEIEQGQTQVGSQVQNSMECESVQDIYKQSMPPTDVPYRADAIPKLNKAIAETDGSCSASSYYQKNHVGNQLAIKRFKDLREKIRHAMKESKHERHRITLDAVLHKVPHGQGFSRDLKKENFDQLGDIPIKSDGADCPASRHESDHNTLSALSGKSGLHCMRRAPSFSGSLNTYSQLYDSCFNREAKQYIPGKLKLRREEAALPSRSTPKPLRRILSSPELKSYFYQGEDPFDASSSLMLVKAPVEGTVSISSFDTKNSTESIASEYSLQLHTRVESQIQQNLAEVSETGSVAGDQVGSTSVAYSNADTKVVIHGDDLCNLMTGNSTSDNERDIDIIAAKVAEPDPVPVLDFNFQEVAESTAKFSILEESEVELGFLLTGEQNSLTSQGDETSIDDETVAHSSDLEKVEIAGNHVHIGIPHAQVDAKNKAKFDYVTNVLKLSGFSGNESLGTWHCDYQPVDPSVYEEVEGCTLPDLDCSEYEGENCNHMLLFDIINEVLMEIYERSYSYYPTPLSSLCRNHPMPAGTNVLKEVWSTISWYLSLRPELDQSLNYIASGDLSKNSAWMNLQIDTECLGIELEDLIFEQLLEEAIFSQVFG